MYVRLAPAARRRARLRRASWLPIALAIAAAIVARPEPIGAHGGPPFPILSDRIAGPYKISVWADPDTTDDGSAAGEFWVVLVPAADSIPIPADTRASVAITPLDGAGSMRTGRTEPVDGDVSRQFVALPIDREGRLGVRITVSGALGAAEVETVVDAMYDERPPPVILALYLVPFLFAGFLGVKLLIRRRASEA
jgi:hypothetical protein